MFELLAAAHPPDVFRPANVEDWRLRAGRVKNGDYIARLTRGDAAPPDSVRHSVNFVGNSFGAGEAAPRARMPARKGVPDLPRGRPRRHRVSLRLPPRLSALRSRRRAGVRRGGPDRPRPARPHRLPQGVGRLRRGLVTGGLHRFPVLRKRAQDGSPAAVQEPAGRRSGRPDRSGDLRKASRRRREAGEAPRRHDGSSDGGTARTPPKHTPGDARAWTSRVPQTAAGRCPVA
jgi:hypothetical protein